MIPFSISAPLPRVSRSRITSQSEQQNASHPRNDYIVNLRRWAFSSLSSITFNDLLVRIILTLLTGLLLSNSILFYKLWILEEGLIESQGSRVQQDFYDTTKSRKVGTENDTPSYETVKDPNFQTIKTTSDWLQLLHRQEVAHQLELEKWHAILGAATELLRQVCNNIIEICNHHQFLTVLYQLPIQYFIYFIFQTEQSLTNLQRSIHPLSLKNLGNLLRFQNSDWNSLIQNLQTFDTNSKDANEHIETNFKSDEHVNNQHIPSLNQPYENDKIEL